MPKDYRQREMLVGLKELRHWSVMLDSLSNLAMVRMHTSGLR